jgi:hypothetical protein
MVRIQIIFNLRYSESMIEYRQAGMPSYGDVIKAANLGLSLLRPSMLS